MKLFSKSKCRSTIQIDKSADIIIKRLCEMQTTSPEHPVGYNGEDYFGRFKFYCNKKGEFHVNEFIAPGIKKSRYLSGRLYYVQGKVIDTDFDKCTVKIYWIFDRGLFAFFLALASLPLLAFLIFALIFREPILWTFLVLTALSTVGGILYELHFEQEHKGQNLNIMHNMVIERVNSAKKAK